VFAAQRHDRAWTRNWLLATMAFGTAFIVLHGMEWTKLIHEGLTLPGFPKPAGQSEGEFANISTEVPQFAATFFGLTAMHMLHVTIGRDLFGCGGAAEVVPADFGSAVAGGIFSDSVGQRFSLRGMHALLIGLIVARIILFLKPKDYDAHDVEVSGLYWHFVDLVWMFIFRWCI
jgi:heme/copper-type cytochrome/quinol oxidase subunit 3